MNKKPPENNMAVLKLHDLADVLSDQLKRMDPYWEKCFPCSNSGKCCENVDVPLYKAEWNLIWDYLYDLAPEDLLIVQNNLKNNIKCPFRLPSKCAIHTVRPLYCRITPYRAIYHEKATEIEVMYPADNCTFVRQHHMRVTNRLPQPFEQLGGRFFLVSSNVIDKTPEMTLLLASGKPKYLSTLLDSFDELNI